MSRPNFTRNMNEQIKISESVREKVLKRDMKLTAQERLEVEALYLLIGKRKLSKGCTDCLKTAYQIIENWMTYHAPRKNTMPPKATKVQTVKVEEAATEEAATEEAATEEAAVEEIDDLLGEVPAPANGLMGFKLRELREMYPEIAAANPGVKTIKDFVALVEKHEQQ
jgi:hypothetical protein